MTTLREAWQKSQEYVDIVETCIDDGAKEHIAQEFADKIADFFISHLRAEIEGMRKEIQTEGTEWNALDADPACVNGWNSALDTLLAKIT